LTAAGSGSHSALAAEGYAFKLCPGHCPFVIGPVRFHKGQSSQPVALECEATGLLGKHPAGNGLLEVGRNRLREYAQ
jgi:hypothetical protein